MSKTLVFDFDGTIANTMTLVMGIANEILPEIGRQPITDDDIEKMRKMTIPQGFKYLGIPLYKLPQLVIKSRAKMKARIGDLAPIEGIGQTLVELKESGVNMGIVTSNSAENVKSFLRRNKYTKLFSFVDAGSSPFSKSRSIKSALKRHNLSIEECVYVGDEIRDIEAAQSIELTVVAVSWGINHPDALRKENPDYFVTKPNQLINIAKE